MIPTLLIRALRAWYRLRELLGHPRRLDGYAFDRASTTVLLAGSPWRFTAATSSTGSVYTVYVTNTNWNAP